MSINLLNTFTKFTTTPDWINGGYVFNGTLTAANHYINIGCVIWTTVDTTDMASVVPEAKSLQNYSCHVFSNSSVTSADHIRPYINGSDGNGDISIAVGVTGSFQDTSNTDVLSALDRLAWHFTEGTTASIVIITVGCEVV